MGESDITGKAVTSVSVCEREGTQSDDFCRACKRFNGDLYDEEKKLNDRGHLLLYSFIISNLSFCSYSLGISRKGEVLGEKERVFSFLCF